MTEAVPWLPDCALTAARTLDPVTACIHAWSREWLSRACLCLPPRWEREGVAGLESAGFEAHHVESGFSLMLGAEARLDLASAMLAREIAERDLRTAQDRQAIAHLVDCALGDLGARLSDAMPRDEDNGARRASGGTVLVIPVSVSESEAPLLIALTRGSTVRLARGRAGSPRDALPVSPIRLTVETLELRLAARVGTSRLPLSDLGGMGVGDVLTLDTPLAEPLAACIDGRRSGEGALAILPRDGRIVLQIERPASQW